MSTKIKQQLKSFALTKPLFLLIIFFSIALLLFSCDTDDFFGNENTTETLSGTFNEELRLKNTFNDPLKPDYIVSGDIVINDKLIVEPGVRIEFEEDKELEVSADGVILAEGTESDMIVFTTANREAGKHWKGLLIRSSDQRNVLEFVKVEFAGNSSMKLGPYSSQNRKANVGVDDNAKLSVLQSEISNSKGYGLFVRGTIIEHQGNAYNSNFSGALSTHIQNAGAIDYESEYTGNGYNGPEMYGGVLEQGITMGKLSQDAAYRISDNIEVESYLFITEGVRIELDEDVMIVIQEGSGGSVNDGYIDVAGIDADPVVFTTSNLAGGHHWKGIYIKTSDTRNKMNNVIVEYAGNSNIPIGPYSSQSRSANIGIDTDASFEISNAIIRNSKGWGIAAMQSSNLLLENITYESNAEGDLTIVD